MAAPYLNIHPLQLAAPLGKIMSINSCFNFKLTKCIGVLYARDVIGCNEWKTEKRHECKDMGKFKQLEL